MAQYATQPLFFSKYQCFNGCDKFLYLGTMLLGSVTSGRNV